MDKPVALLPVAQPARTGGITKGKSVTRTKTAQRSLRLTLTARNGHSKTLAAASSAEFNNHTLPFVRLPDCGEEFARALHREIDDTLNDLQRAQAAALPFVLARLRGLQSIVGYLLRGYALPPVELEKSASRGTQPLTVADYAEALRDARERHRPPDWWSPNRDTLDEILVKLDVIHASQRELMAGGVR